MLLIRRRLLLRSSSGAPLVGIETAISAPFELHSLATLWFRSTLKSNRSAFIFSNSVSICIILHKKTAGAPDQQQQQIGGGVGDYRSKDAFQMGGGDCRSKDAFQIGGAGDRRRKDAFQRGGGVGDTRSKDAYQIGGGVGDYRSKDAFQEGARDCRS
jgi:hypothetical protein